MRAGQWGSVDAGGPQKLEIYFPGLSGVYVPVLIVYIVVAATHHEGFLRCSSARRLPLCFACESILLPSKLSNYNYIILYLYRYQPTNIALIMALASPGGIEGYVF